MAGHDDPSIFHRLGPALAAFGFAAAVLVAVVATTPDDSPPRVAFSPDPAERTDDAGQSATDELAAPNPTPAPLEELTSAPEPDVLGENEQPVARPREGLAVVVGDATIAVDQTGPGALINGVVRARWTLDGTTVASVAGDAPFISVVFSLAGMVGFAPNADAVLDIRCTSGDCPPEWSTWTPLPVGVVEPTAATTLIARIGVARDAVFELRPHADPTVYRTS